MKLLDLARQDANDWIRSDSNANDVKHPPNCAGAAPKKTIKASYTIITTIQND